MNFQPGSLAIVINGLRSNEDRTVSANHTPNHIDLLRVTLVELTGGISPHADWTPLGTLVSTVVSGYTPSGLIALT